MKKVFVIYWLSYAILLYLSTLDMSITPARIVGYLFTVNFSFVVLCPLALINYGKKSRSSDPAYMNACFCSAIIRVVVQGFMYWGMRNVDVITALNLFGMLVFILIERKIKRISQSYFEH